MVVLKRKEPASQCHVFVVNYFIVHRGVGDEDHGDDGNGRNERKVLLSQERLDSR